MTKTEMILQLQQQMETLIEDNQKLVKQMSTLVKNQADLDRRLAKLEEKE